MNIVKSYAKIYTMGGPKFSIEDGKSLLFYIESIGRVSHRSEDKQTGDSWERFIKAVVLEHGDWSITEHCSVTVEALVDRGITHEWVRHRLGAYTQESTRFVNYTRRVGLNFIHPPGLEEEGELPTWMAAMEDAEQRYNTFVLPEMFGLSPQIARSILPNALASKLIVTYNLRSWRHFFLMRTTKESHPQMREVTIPLLQEFKDTIPLLYDDIEPNARQIENMRKPR